MLLFLLPLKTFSKSLSVQGYFYNEFLDIYFDFSSSENNSKLTTSETPTVSFILERSEKKYGISSLGVFDKDVHLAVKDNYLVKEDTETNKFLFNLKAVPNTGEVNILHNNLCLAASTLTKDFKFKLCVGDKDENFKFVTISSNSSNDAMDDLLAQIPELTLDGGSVNLGDLLIPSTSDKLDEAENINCDNMELNQKIACLIKKRIFRHDIVHHSKDAKNYFNKSPEK